MPADSEHGKYLIANAFERFDLKRRGFGQQTETAAVGDGWRLAAAKNFRANCQMQLIDQTGLE